jgi:hypothetical protein
MDAHKKQEYRGVEMMCRNKMFITALLVSFVLSAASSATAKVSPEEAAKLKQELTPFGAERAGNADGTIPAWEGGVSALPSLPAHAPGEFYADPFADDKVLFSITSKNLAQYADKLTVGQQAMFNKYPETYRIDVYPTRRSHAAPQWIDDEVFKNATRVSITDDGYGVVGGYGAIPYPIPKRAEEVVHNHQLRYQGGIRIGVKSGGVVLSSGTYSEGGGARVFEKYSYAIKGGSEATYKGGKMWASAWNRSPARRKGELLLVKDPIDQSADQRRAWQYFPGQRRVRRAPTVAYDTPDPGRGGASFYDETFLFNGALDRFDWKIIGKKELYIPYNNYKLELVPRKELATAHHINPDFLRWELHRVWEVEATLKEGKRHAYGKRFMYFDEDSWTLELVDNYDVRGNLWKTLLGSTLNFYDVPCTSQRLMVFYNLLKEDYAIDNMNNGYDKFIAIDNKELSDDFFTPENLRRQGRR